MDAVFIQEYDPLGNQFFSTVASALPVAVLFFLLVVRRTSATWAASGGALTALILAVALYKMPVGGALAAFGYGCAFGLLPVAWTVFNAMLMYNLTVVTGKFDYIRRSVAGLSPDHRIQAVVIGFAFGAFLEGAAGGGTPVAICGALLVGLGFNPFLAACLCLIANTSPVAFGGLGIPLLVLGQVTGLDIDKLSITAGRQLPIMSFLVPIWMVRTMVNWRRTFEVLPVLLVAGGSFAVCQFFFAHQPYPLFGLCDIAGGIVSLVASAIFLKFWKPRSVWRYDTEEKSVGSPLPDHAPAPTAPENPHAAEAAALVDKSAPAATEEPLGAGRVVLGWFPFAVMFLLFVLLGLFKDHIEGTTRIELTDKTFAALEAEGVPAAVVEKLRPLQTRWWPNLGALDNLLVEELGSAQAYLTHHKTILKHAQVVRRIEPVQVGPVSAVIRVPVPGLHQQVLRGERVLSSGQRELPIEHREREAAVFTFNWLSTPGTLVLASTLISLLALRPTAAQLGETLRRTVIQMKIPVPTIAVMMGLGFVTRYAGLDATLGLAFTLTGYWLYPYFAALLGWLGVFLTGTDASSNALFGSLQKITATSLGLNPILIATANSTGGVMGKMIDAQSICVATAATDQVGKEADIFKFVVWHSFILASLVGLIVMFQAHVVPWMIPTP